MLKCVQIFVVLFMLLMGTFVHAQETFPEDIYLPSLQTHHGEINKAFRIAVGDLLGNVALHRRGLLEEESMVVIAGMGYQQPWTRDAAINAWNGASLIMPTISKNTLLSVLIQEEGKLRIGGQYWDAIVWAQGAWNHYLYTGDREFLEIAYDAVQHSLAYFEATEFDPGNGLFRGPGWSDGIAAYPDVYTSGADSSGILDWPLKHPDQAVKPGYGIPMQAISTNCLYYGGYVVAAKMETALGLKATPAFTQKAAALKKSINKHLWMEDKGHYRFFTDPFGGCDHQEALGHAYAILFGVTNPAQTESIFNTLHVTPAGVPCVWPTFARYENAEGTAYGRHSGTVWPQIQGFWAEAAAQHGKTDLLAHELFRLAAHACRDMQFYEMFHPDTGLPYGGMQESRSAKVIKEWRPAPRQTWAATAYLRMILFNVAGMRFAADGVTLAPCLPEGLSPMTLRNIHYRDMTLDITLEGQGTKIQQCSINGATHPSVHLGAAETGHKHIMLTLSD